MTKRRLGSLVVGGLVGATVAVAGVGSAPLVGATPVPTTAPALPSISFDDIGTYDPGLGNGSAEIAAYDDGKLYVIAGDKIDVVSLATPSSPVKIGEIALPSTPTSVSVSNGNTAVALPADPTQDPGTVRVTVRGMTEDYKVGSLPDMVTFTPDGSRVLVANEGEPEGYEEGDVDPEGSISMITLTGKALLRDSLTSGPATDSLNFGWTGATTYAGNVLGGPETEFISRVGNLFDIYDRDGNLLQTLAYGTAEDEVFVGDWNGDGYDTLAVRRGNVFYVKDTLAGGPADRLFGYGRPGDQVFLGDFDGNGSDGIAVRRGNVIYVRQTLTSGPATTVFGYGLATDGLLVGDWDGVGAETFSVKRGNQLLINNSLRGGPAQRTISFGAAGDITLAGDWNGDGTTTLAVFRPLTEGPTTTTFEFTDFDEGGPRAAELPDTVRIFGPGASVAEDLEPEYITVSPDGAYAWVSLQENNALAKLDLTAGTVAEIIGLGYSDHSMPGYGIDASDRDGLVNIANWPVMGMYMPDAISAFETGGTVYVATANEGDAREYDGFEEEFRGDDFPDAADDLLDDTKLARLTFTAAAPSDGTAAGGLYSFGSRSFSIWNGMTGELVFDSGDDFEQIVAQTNPAFFGSDNDENTFDTRSDAKGPEPEAIATGMIDGRNYAFIGLERVGGVMVYDITDPTAPVFQQYLQNRVFAGGDDAETIVGDSAPESITFVSADDSTTGTPMILVSNEVSGTVGIWALGQSDGAGVLTLLHNNDGESTIQPLSAPTVDEAGSVNVAGVAAYKAVLDREINDARSRGNAVLNVYAGDAFLASATLACSLPPNPADTPVYDALAQAEMAYDAHILGNHEFDFGPDYLERFIRTFEQYGTPVQPFLSGNLDFAAEAGYADLIDSDGLIMGVAAGGKVVGETMINVDEATGMKVGIVAATTPDLRRISSPRAVEITTTDIESTATLLQGHIDSLEAQGINKIVLVSHLQGVDNDKELIELLSGVDVAVAGGGDEILSNPNFPLLPGSPDPAGSYPLLDTTDADGKVVPIVTTEGNYKYVGRVDIVFTADGRGSVITSTSGPRRVIEDTVIAAPAEPGVDEPPFEDAVTPDAGLVRTVVEPVETCLAALSEPIAQTEVALNVSRQGNESFDFDNGVRTGETNSGNLATDAYLAAYDTYGPAAGLPARTNTVIAIQNGGGMRQNGGDIIPKVDADPVDSITRRDTLDFLAFLTNSVTVIEDITPAELKEILERSASGLPGAAGQFLQVGGIEVTIDLAGTAQVVDGDAGTVTTPGTRIVTVTLTDGTPIITAGQVDAAAPAAFSIVTNSFTAAGGDTFTTLGNLPESARTQLPATYEQALVEYLLTFPEDGGLPTIPASDVRYADPDGEGRITIIPAP